MPSSDQLIITAASKSFGKSLLALVGSLTLNWAHHPPVIVYDIGLDDATRATLAQHRVIVRVVPPFCPHWRRHFTWKPWCWNDAPARDVLWLDAGLVVLQPLGEIFAMIATRGYFIVPTGRTLLEAASAEACTGVAVEPDFRKGKLTFAGGVFGFRKDGIIQQIIAEALQLAYIERFFAATEPLHRHDQAILSLLLYKNLPQVEWVDATLYLESALPRKTPGQKIWVHRRAISSRDAAHYADHISTPGEKYLPHPTRSWRSWLPLYRLRRWLAARHPRFLHDGVRD